MKHDVPHEQLDAALSVVAEGMAPEKLMGVYLYGSAVDGGLRPDSDLDLFVVTRDRLTHGEKRRLVDGLLPISGRETRPPSWRPLDLTVVVQSEVRPWRYPPRWDLQYGEWLRPQFLAGELQPWPSTNPDLAVLITMVLSNGRPLPGPDPRQILDPVPRKDLVRAMADEIPQLLGELELDTRNVLLTLARIWSTVATGGIKSKDAAARWALARLPSEHRNPLAEAQRLYLNGGDGTWDDTESLREHVAFVVEQIERHVARTSG